jgi:hypothetical protein
VLVAKGDNPRLRFAVFGGEDFPVDGALLKLPLQNEPLTLKLKGAAGVLIDGKAGLLFLLLLFFPECLFLFLPTGFQNAEFGSGKPLDGG